MDMERFVRISTLTFTMEKSTATAAAAHPASAAAAGPKVSQIANLFQRKPVELTQDVQTRSDRPTAESAAATHSPTATVVRTESHAARFNNARALFEKLGEGRVNRPPPFSIKMSHSSSKEDNLSDIGSGPDRSPSPKRKQLHQQQHPPAAISNGIGKLDSNRILNQSRLKSEKPEKPEKPERKFNSRELIEKQKNWTSHFSKTRTAKGTGGSDFNRCDIIRTVPGTGIIAGAGANAVAPVTAVPAPTTNGNYSAIPNGGSKEQQQLPFAAERNGTGYGHGPHISSHHRLPSPSEPPPSPPKRQTPPPPPPPEKGPRTANLRQNSFPSPTKTPPAVPPHATDPASLSPTKQSPEKLKPPPRQAEPPPSSAVTTAPHANLPPVAPVRSSTTVLTTVHHQQQQQQLVSSASIEQQQQVPPPPEKAIRKKSLEGNLDERLPAGNGVTGTTAANFKYPELGALARRQSSEKDTGSGGLTSPAHAISSSPSPGASASSGPSSPIHTEDEKQENESTEKLMNAGSSSIEREDSPPANEAKPVEELNGSRAKHVLFIAVAMFLADGAGSIRIYLPYHLLRHRHQIRH
uniref:Uncharacterized protein n=1 Tax=Anopheles christyi TaxID=43041 RepID=A0A182K002_9DIPT